MSSLTLTGQAPPRSDMIGLVDKIEVVATAQHQQRLLERLARRDQVTTLSFVNAHGFNLCWKSADVLAAFRRADILLRDGIGMKVLFRLLGREAGLNMNGTDFIPEILRHTRGQRVALLGTTDEVIANAGRLLAADGISIVTTLNGFEPDQAYLDAVATHSPDIIVLGMGMPRQEGLAARLAAAATRPCLIINGGAIIDFIGGKVRRAPLAMRRLGLEWVWRLMLEPRRLFHRYVVGNAVFLNHARQLVAGVGRAGTAPR